MIALFLFPLGMYVPTDEFKRTKGVIMSKQKMLEAKLRQAEIARKRRPLQESGGLKSQWGSMTSETRMLGMGHYMKSGERAELDYLREQARKLKKASKPTSIVHIVR